MNDQHRTGNHGGAIQTAPWLPIPSRALSSVEHPCIVKNVDKGITSLGGPVRLSKVRSALEYRDTRLTRNQGLRSKLETTTNAAGDDELKSLITVTLRPDDPFAKRLLSTPVRTNNLLLKVTVPKRTGRKRKRGSSGPFLAEGDAVANSNGASNSTSSSKHSYASASTIYRSLQDNASSYKIAIAGVVDETHRFRSMPDLQYTAFDNEAMIALRDHVLPKRHSQLKKFSPNTAPGPNLTKSLGPSAEFLQMPIAVNYQFEQNSFIKYTDRGVVNIQRSTTYSAFTIIKPTDDYVPKGPKPSLPAEASLTPYLQTLIKHIRAELKKRPIITRHLLYNKLGWDKRAKLRQAAVYCGYFFETGPWREALVRWGVDPRKDPKYRRYQTVSFLSYSKSGISKHHKGFDQHVWRLSQMSPKELANAHTFDGINVSQTGNLFQFCDITDPLITKILATEDIRTTCAPTFQGWYHVGTWAKAVVILKDKMNTIIGGAPPDDSIYQRIMTWPEQWEDQEIAATYKEEMRSREVHEEKKKEHDVMHYVRWTARNPRYAFEKMEAPTEQAREAEAQAEEAMEDAEVPEDMTEVPVTAEEFLDEESDSDENEDDEDDDENGDEGDDQDEDIDGVWEDDDSDDNPIMSTRAVSEGPAPFGGLYRV
ncbi:tau 95 subunit of transcription factor TFIIIC [Neocucurbitaria cava]|uniref:Tau 95 subunit of transcription factor TFIIIC n=1 Tax=Neocucurbitaria cava TaxID=798079 RepID=A0A9W9CS45_9PLEO|nr:tau 95 subunit of transcription factor TFIIIC [Neocucurbitaria cava]